MRKLLFVSIVLGLAFGMLSENLWAVEERPNAVQSRKGNQSVLEEQNQGNKVPTPPTANPPAGANQANPDNNTPAVKPEITTANDDESAVVRNSKKTRELVAQLS